MADMEQQLQENAWNAAQSIPLSVDLVSAAKAHRRFLARISDLHPFLLRRGPILMRAVHRYQNYWLPLLADQGGSGQLLLPPLDCAWVWHCHKLSPLQYIKDCESRYGKLLDTPPATEHLEKAAEATQLLWNSLYPEEPYEVDLEHFSGTINLTGNDGRKIMYDLESAVMRQAPFYHQVSEAHMGETSFLNNALQRYRGYLYLIKLSGLKMFLVPTFDIDLLWHSHQNCPTAYKEDMLKLLGKVLNHDDTEPDRSEGQKLDVGFHRTREYWQRTFGSVYERAGAMYRGEPPQPLSLSPPVVMDSAVDLYALTGQYDACLRLRETMQVFVTILGVRNVHSKHSGTLAVQLLFQKNCASLKLRTSWVKSELGMQWNSFWGFQCATSTEGLRFELLLQKSNCFGLLGCLSVLGYVDISWKAILDSPTLSWDGWVPLLMKSKSYKNCKPASLKISLSVTPPVSAPYLLRIESLVPAQNEESVVLGGHESCITRAILDHTNQEVFTTHICGWSGAGHSKIHILPGGSTDGSGAEQLMRKIDTEVPSSRKWSLFDDAAQLVVTKNAENLQESCHFSVHLTGPLSQSVRLVTGRRYQYQIAGATQGDEGGFMTLIRYTRDAPFGKASALLNWRSGVLEVSPGENVVLIILLAIAIAYSVHDMQNMIIWKTKGCIANSSNLVTSSDEWSSVILNAGSSCAEDMLKYRAWYSIGSSLWLSTYNVCPDCGGCGNAKSVHDDSDDSSGSGCGSGCGNANAVHDSSDYSSGSGSGCGSGRCKNSDIAKEYNAVCVLGSSCGGCGSGGGCGNSSTTNKYNVEHMLGSGCGGCGSGGCGNENTIKCVLGTGCGGCGSGGCGGGCGNDNTIKCVLGTGCGGCGSGGCGGGCGNGMIIKEFHVLGSGCGGCGSGSCGGGCGNNINAKGFNAEHVLGSGGCGSGSCGGGCGSGNIAIVFNAENVLGSGCGGCGGGGCGGGCGNGNTALGSNDKCGLVRK